MLKKIATAFDGLISWLENIAAAVLVSLVLIITLHVFLRYVLHSPIDLTTQFASYTPLVFACLGATQLLRLERHVSIDIFILRVNSHVRNLVNFFTSILGVLICIVILWFGSKTTIEQAVKNTLVMDAIKFPQYYITVIIPFTFFLLGLQFARRTFDLYRKLFKHELKAASK